MNKSWVGWALVLGLVGIPGAKAGQVSPTPQTSVSHSGTADGAAHTVLAAGTPVAGFRVDCMLQNTGSNVMYYSFAGAASSSTKQLVPGATMNCSNGITVDTGALSLLGTNGDTYVLTESFVAAQ